MPWRGAQWLAPLEAFLDRVETAFGRVPMIYTSRRVWQTHVHDDPAFARFGDYPLWTADYMAHPPVIANAQRYATRLARDPLIPAPWSTWTTLAVLRRLHTEGRRRDPVACATSTRRST